MLSVSNMTLAVLRLQRQWIKIFRDASNERGAWGDKENEEESGSNSSLSHFQEGRNVSLFTFYGLFF